MFAQRMQPEKESSLPLSSGPVNVGCCACKMSAQVTCLMSDQSHVWVSDALLVWPIGGSRDDTPDLFPLLPLSAWVILPLWGWP